MQKLNIFKLTLVLLFIALLGILFRYSQILDQYAKNGRYYYDAGGYIIIDTRTGAAYTLNSIGENKGVEKLNDSISN